MNIQEAIHSEAMDRTLPYRVLLPEDYEESGLSYPVLFLLHGLFGAFENWAELTSIVEEAADYQLIVVMPEGGDWWYTDSATVSRDQFETFFFSEFVPRIHKTYRIPARRSARGIGGLSMGGYGAFKFAFKHPEMFSLAVSFSGAFDCAERSDARPGFDWPVLRPSILKVFGGIESHTRSDNDLFSLVEQVPTEQLSAFPFFHFNCGTDDGFIDTNRRLHELMTRRGIAHSYEEIVGAHDWEYWSGQTSNLLRLSTKKLIKAKQEISK